MEEIFGGDRCVYGVDSRDGFPGVTYLPRPQVVTLNTYTFVWVRYTAVERLKTKVDGEDSDWDQVC